MKKKGFTLIEMLIVIVIIGILAGALVPRVGHARGKANDAVRQTYAYGVSSAIVQYQIDNNSYPTINDDAKINNCNCSTLKNALGNKLINYGYGEDSLPKDPIAGTSFNFCGSEVTGGQYVVCFISDSVLFVSKLEGEGGNAFSADFSAPDAVTSDMTLSNISDKLHGDGGDLYIFYG